MEVLLMKTTVEYIHHSGYAVETEKHMIIFDYFKGNLPISDKPTLVIATHGHEDHFNKEILKLEGNVKILLSSDIKEDYKLEPQSNMFFIQPNQKRFIGDFQVETFGSTDRGISVFVSVDNLGIFHAGDLNLWIWEEDTKEERLQMTKEFKDEIAKIRLKSIDIAMFPVDPRLGSYADSGVSYFLDAVRPAHLFPMHFWGDLSTAKKLKDEYKSEKTTVHLVENDNQKFEFDI